MKFRMDLKHILGQTTFNICFEQSFQNFGRLLLQRKFWISKYSKIYSANFHFDYTKITLKPTKNLFKLNKILNGTNKALSSDVVYSKFCLDYKLIDIFIWSQNIWHLTLIYANSLIYFCWSKQPHETVERSDEIQFIFRQNFKWQMLSSLLLLQLRKFKQLNLRTIKTHRIHNFELIKANMKFNFFSFFHENTFKNKIDLFYSKIVIHDLDGTGTSFRFVKILK